MEARGIRERAGRGGGGREERQREGKSARQSEREQASRAAVWHGSQRGLTSALINQNPGASHEPLKIRVRPCLPFNTTCRERKKPSSACERKEEREGGGERGREKERDRDLPTQPAESARPLSRFC